MSKSFLTLTACLCLIGSAKAFDLVVVESVDVERKEFTAKGRFTTYVTVEKEEVVLQNGKQVAVKRTVQVPQITEALSKYSLGMNSFLTGDAKKLTPAEAAKTLHKGSVVVVGGEEIRPAVEAKAFRPEVTVLIRSPIAPPLPPSAIAPKAAFPKIVPPLPKIVPPFKNK